MTQDSKNGHGQKFENIHQNIIEASQERSKNSVCSRQPIDDKLQNFQIDNQKPDINKEMENGGNGALEHFLLAKGHQQHVF